MKYTNLISLNCIFPLEIIRLIMSIYTQLLFCYVQISYNSIAEYKKLEEELCLFTFDYGDQAYLNRYVFSYSSKTESKLHQIRKHLNDILNLCHKNVYIINYNNIHGEGYFQHFYEVFNNRQNRVSIYNYNLLSKSYKFKINDKVCIHNNTDQVIAEGTIHNALCIPPTIEVEKSYLYIYCKGDLLKYKSYSEIGILKPQIKNMAYENDTILIDGDVFSIVLTENGVKFIKFEFF